jgi:hypothetical protein
MKQFEMSTEFYFLTVSEPSEPVNIFTYQLKENHLYVSCVIRANIATSNDQYDHLDLRPSVLNSIIKDLKIKVHGILTTDPTGPEIYRIKALWSYPRTGVASAPKLPSPCVCSTWNELKKRQTTSHGDPKEQQKKRILDKITSKQGEHDIISESVSSSTSTASDVAQLSIHKHKNKKEFKKKREKRLYCVLGKFPCYYMVLAYMLSVSIWIKGVFLLQPTFDCLSVLELTSRLVIGLPVPPVPGEPHDKFPTRMDSSHRSPGYGNVSCPTGYET